MKKHFIQYLSYLLVAVLAACGQSSTQTTDAENADSNAVALSVTLTEMQVKNAGIVLGQVSTQPINQKIKASGKLDVPPQNLNSISAPYGGFLKSTNLLQGMHVHKGDIVAVMEHPDYIQLQQDYLENKSQLTYLKTELERQQELAKEEINSKKTLQKAKAEYETMHARVQGLRAKLELIKIDVNKLEQGTIQKTINLIAPINGYVTKVNTNIGAFVTANTVLFELVDTEHLHAEVSVFEKDLGTVKIGQQVAITLANETKTRLAKVYLIGKEITDDRTVRVHCHLNEEDNTLIPGMYLTAYIDVQAQGENALPDDAVVNHEGKSLVFELVENASGQFKFVPIEVTVLGTENGYTAIQASTPLTAKKLVTNGAYKVLSAMMNTPEE